MPKVLLISGAGENLRVLPTALGSLPRTTAFCLLGALAWFAPGLGCTGPSQPARASAAASSSARSPVIAAPAATVPRVPCANRAALDSMIPGAAWHAPLEKRTGELSLVTDDQLLVAWQRGGKSVSVDLEHGSICAVLGQPPGETHGSPIDPNAEYVGVRHGALVGPRGSSISAVEVGSGAVRWKRAPLSPGNTNQFALYEGIEFTSTAKGTVVWFPARFRDGDSFRHEEIVAALDPRTGVDLWRKTVASGQSLARDTIRISSDSERVFVRSDGKLQALDENGKQMWTVTEPPHTAKAPRRAAKMDESCERSV